MKVQSYKELDVWRKGIEIVDRIYQATSEFPDSERFGLAAQMRRAAVSIPTNVAEGFSRRHSREYIQACHVALGSCAELETELIIARRRASLEKEPAELLAELLDHEARMLMNLIKSLSAEVSNHESRSTNHDAGRRR